MFLKKILGCSLWFIEIVYLHLFRSPPPPTLIGGWRRVRLPLATKAQRHRLTCPQIICEWSKSEYSSGGIIADIVRQLKRELNVYCIADIRVSETDTWHTNWKIPNAIGSVKYSKCTTPVGQILNLRFFTSNRHRAFEIEMRRASLSDFLNAAIQTLQLFQTGKFLVRC